MKSKQRIKYFIASIPALLFVGAWFMLVEAASPEIIVLTAVVIVVCILAAFNFKFVLWGAVFGATVGVCLGVLLTLLLGSPDKARMLLQPELLACISFGMLAGVAGGALQGTNKQFGKMKKSIKELFNEIRHY